MNKPAASSGMPESSLCPLCAGSGEETVWEANLGAEIEIACHQCGGTGCLHTAAQRHGRDHRCCLCANEQHSAYAEQLESELAACREDAEKEAFANGVRFITNQRPPSSRTHDGANVLNELRAIGDAAIDAAREK